MKLYRVGGKLLTTEEDLFRFFETVAAADQEHFDCAPVATPPSPKCHRTRQEVQQAIDDANRELDDAGFGEVA